MKKNLEWVISRILYPARRAMIIYLGCRSPGTSCNLPGDFRRAAFKRLSIWSCTRWGLPCLPCHHGSGELLPRHFNLTCECMHSIGGVFSVALSIGYPKFALRTTVPCGVRTFLSGMLAGAINRPPHFLGRRYKGKR